MESDCRNIWQGSGGYVGPEMGRTQREYFHCDHHQLIPHPYARPFLPYAHDMDEAIWREIEKERIREEIIMSEIRRRELEAEVRRELMMERGGDGLPFGSPSVMGFGLPRRHPMVEARADMRFLEDRRIISSLAEPLPFQRGRISEVKPFPEEAKEKGRIILLAKPSERTLGVKREASVSAASQSPAERNSRKKAKEEWSCAICQVSTTSEQALNEHLQGKKHKSNVAGLRAKTSGKNYIIGLYPKKTAKATTTNPTSINQPKVASQSLPSDDKTGENSSKTDDGPLSEESPNSVKVKENIKPAGAQEMQEDQKLLKKKFKYWCEVCQVGCHSPKVLNAHVDGKKHKRRVNICKQNGGAGACDEKNDAVDGPAEEEAIAEDCRDVVVNESVDHDSTEVGVGG